MANKKISQLPTSTTVTDSDLLIINDNGVTKTATREALLDGITRNVTDSGNDAVVSGDLDVANQITAGGDIFTTGNISFGSLTDHLTGVTVLTMVDSGGGVETFDSSIATSSAIKGYISAQDFGLDSVAVLQLINENPGIDSAGVLSLVTGSDLDMGGNKVLFGNVYDSVGGLPNASTYHGMFAHVHATGAAYFAHAGNWVQLANNGSGGSGVDSAQVIGILEDGVNHILPSLDSTYDLGSPTQKWKDLYLSGSTINLGNKTISQSGNNLVIGNASAVVATAFIGDGSGLTGVSGSGGGLTEDDVIDLINQNQQSGGINARAVKILPLNGQVVRYDSDGNEEDTLTFRAVPENGANTLTYKWFVKAAAAPDTAWIVEQDGPLTDFTLADADEPGAEGVKVIKCEMYENTDGTDSAEKAQDIMTVYGLANGFGITGFLTNESHVEPADSTGSLTTAVNDAGGTFKVFLGTNDITTDPAVTFSNPSNSGINVTIDNNGVYALNSSPNADAAFASLATLSGSAVFEANIGSSLIPNSNTDMVIEKKYTIAKSLRGSTGSSGSDAITLDLTNENHSITAAKNGTPYTNSFSGAETTLNIFKGSSALSVPSGDISVTPASSSSGVTYTLSNGNKTLTVTDMAANVDEETLTFSIGGSTEAAGKSTVFSLTKVKDGEDGDPATVYRLVTSSNTVVLDSDGTTFRPPSLSLSQQRVIGNQTPTSADYGRIRARITNNGTTGSFSALTDDVNGVATYNLATGDELIELEMQVQDDNSNWVTVDEESIPVISDATSGEGGRGPGTWWIYIGTSTSSQPTTSGQADTAWTNHAPAEAGLPIEGDQAWFYTGTGEAATPTSQTVWLRGASSWEKQEKVIRGDLLVDGTVTADQFATSATTDGQTIIKSNLIHIYSISGSTRTLRVKIGDLSVGALDANGNEI